MNMHESRRLDKSSSSNGPPCPAAGHGTPILFHRIDDVPVNSVVNVRSRTEALNFPRGNIALRFCHACGFDFNASFNPKLIHYSSDCEESQGYSPTFNAFAHQLAEHLVHQYDLHGKKILEIGCGKGEFLDLICELGSNQGIGFDPAYVEGRTGDNRDHHLTFVKDYYSDKYASYTADVICCRMTLEHIPDTAAMVQTVRKAIGGNLDTLVFFQVPDAMRIMRDCAFEDIYYEHCSYFSTASLAQLFKHNGFEVLDLRTDYNGQYIMLEAKPSSAGHSGDAMPGNERGEFRKYVDQFSRRFKEKTGHWSKSLKRIRGQGKKVVLWGSGSKGVAFLTALNGGKDVEYVVDINPFRQGTYMAGTGQRVVSPQHLKEYLPDVVIIMNTIYRNEIKQDLDQMGLQPEILTL